MSGLLRSSLLTLRSLADAAVAKVDEADKLDLENKQTGSVDAEKVKKLIADQSAIIEQQNAAIDQLQQRVSNLEGAVSRLEAEKPIQQPRQKPKPTATPSDGQIVGGGWHRT